MSQGNHTRLLMNGFPLVSLLIAKLRKLAICVTEKRICRKLFFSYVGLVKILSLKKTKFYKYFRYFSSGSYAMTALQHHMVVLYLLRLAFILLFLVLAFIINYFFAI